MPITGAEEVLDFADCAVVLAWLPGNVLPGAADGLPRPVPAAGLRAALPAGPLPRAVAVAGLVAGAAARLPDASFRFEPVAATFATVGLRFPGLTATGTFFAVALAATLPFADVPVVLAECGLDAASTGLRGGDDLPAGLAERVDTVVAAGLAARFGAGLLAIFFTGLPPLGDCTFATTERAFTVARPCVPDLPFVCAVAELELLFLIAISSHHSLAVAAGLYNPSVLYRQARIWNTCAYAHPKLLGRVNPLTRLILWMLHLYKRLLSPLFGPRCRFHPSCSDYARVAVMRFGPWRGSLLALWRLLRCQPLCIGGNDPVPENFHFPHCRRQGESPDGH